MHSGSSLTPSNPAFSISIGIASLVLEGRPLCEDDFIREQQQQQRSDVSYVVAASDATSSQIQLSDTHHMNSAANSAIQQDTIQHFQRLQQKLLLLRSSPSTSRGDHVEQSISIVTGSTGSGFESDEELEMIYKNHQRMNDGTVLSSLQSLATSCLKTTPRSFNKTHHGLLKTVDTSWTTTAAAATSGRIAVEQSSSSVHHHQLSSKLIAAGNIMADNNLKKKLLEKGMKKHHGPHCEQFLKKIGLIKDATNCSTADINNDLDEHFCSDSNENCYRWQIHYRQLVSIFSRGDPICIEVYLGPENHIILLEQWIIQQCVRTNSMTMTLQSLCSAIRSQLYFSQITAWTDLLRTSAKFDNQIKNNPRLKFSASHQPKLDILYRIRPYDTTSCFSNKPTIHHFPDTVVSGSVGVKVCLKSLPRMPTIPHIIVQDEIKLPHFNECTTSQSMIFDDRLNHPCKEKGKHQCSYDEEIGGDDMEATASSTSMISHRDRQLLKYKKRIMKRDKKKRNDYNVTDEPNSDQQQPYYGNIVCDSAGQLISSKKSNSNLYEQTSINSIRPPLYSSSSIQLLTTKSTQTANVETRSVSTQTDLLTDEMFPNCDFCGIEMQYLCWNCDNNLFTQPNSYNNNNSNNNNNQFMSPKRLHGGDLLLQAIQRTPSVKQSAILAKMSKSRYGGNNGCCTRITGTKGRPMDTDKHYRCHEANSDNHVCDRDTLCDKSNCDSLSIDLSDCRLCKRQKIVHNFKYTKQESLNTANNLSIINNSNIKLGEGTGIYRRTMSDSFGYTDDVIDKSSQQQQPEHKQPKQQSTITAIILPEKELKQFRRAYSEDVLECMCEDTANTRPTQLDLDSNLAVTKTHININNTVLPSAGVCNNTDVQTQQQQQQQQQRTPNTTKQTTNDHCIPAMNNTKINPLYVTCTDDIEMIRQKPAMGKEIPKVNLSKVFNLSPVSPWDNNSSYDGDKKDYSTSSPISIGSNYSTFNFETVSPTSSSISNSSIAAIGTSVHKSNSAPTFPNSPVLSPRFLKSAAIHKRRSRHLSDRSSERSSIGSDEQFSDEEFGFGLDNTYSPIISPTKTISAATTGTTTSSSSGSSSAAIRSFPRSSQFSRKSLLGSFEEALLQRCFKPKCQIYGFKVLLGASGGFCPTQMTLASSTYFYEIQHGSSLSTPYTCEIRLPRKGYSVPRLGTVQATLLNPMGMVVRMFVVPYDFRDMPNMSQTFIRQRILAFDESSNPGIDVRNLTAAEQMKILRYAIHLRFQTSRSGRLALHTDLRMLILRRTDCDTAAAHTKDALESPNELKIVTVVPSNPKFSTRLDKF